MVDFDVIDAWKPKLSDVLHPYMAENKLAKLVSVQTKDPSVALDSLFSLGDRNAIFDATIAWIKAVSIVGYHGTRLIDSEVISLKQNGLIPLKSSDRRRRLKRVLSRHDRWPEVESKFKDTIRNFGPGQKGGQREGQSHLTLSRNGLITASNHYLTHGSEFDQRVAYELLGDDGEELLRDDGEPRLVKVAVPGDKALDAAHPHFTVDDLLESGDVPNLVSQFLGSWALKVGHSEFQCRTLEVDCGMIFSSVVPPSWIVNIETGFQFDKSQ